MATQTAAADSTTRASVDPNLKRLNALTILVSAFLLFQVEPLIAKMILPWFGGVAAVWTVCLLFFQALLLLGYLYAHLLTRLFAPRAQGWLHGSILVVSLLLLPILPKDSLKPLGPEHPALHILLVLVLTVGLPFFLLSSTSPLLQAWLANATTGSGVYRLYALSNAGSLLGLWSYPTLIEPRLSTRWQAWSWSVAYVVFVVACGVMALSQRGGSAADRSGAEARRVNWRTRWLWIGLSACSSALLLAVTNHISQNIAAVPFLWIIPLSLYMMSFILCFGSSRWYPRAFFLRLLGVALGGMTYALLPSFAALPFWLMIVLFCGGLFVCCMFCHGELVRLKPDPAQLTSFYFLVSLGSVAGAAFVAILAPQILSAFYELHAALVACAGLVVLVYHNDGSSPFGPRAARYDWVVLNVLAAAVAGCLLFVAVAESRQSTRMVRNFYGVLRESIEVAPNVVVQIGDRAPQQSDDLRFRRLTNGTISHGLQFLAPARRNLPTSYYAPASGVGVAFQALRERGPMRVGVIGLGAGTIAAYGRAGDDLTFYEINPLVVQIAQQDFTFLQDSKAHIALELGDARLTLERQSAQQFDLLAVDAFSGDSIPVHLVTVEAFALYFRHLKPGGILAVHISNKYLHLEPVVGAAAEKLGKDAVTINNPDDHTTGTFQARWVLLANPHMLEAFPAIEKAGNRLASNRQRKLWTDSYSSVFTLLN